MVNSPRLSGGQEWRTQVGYCWKSALQDMLFQHGLYVTRVALTA